MPGLVNVKEKTTPWLEKNIRFLSQTRGCLSRLEYFMKSQLTNWPHPAIRYVSPTHDSLNKSRLLALTGKK
jgi:hypothetical protein